MQIFEVKNDTAKILYEPLEYNLFLSDFVYLEDNNYTIVSQVTNISSTENENYNLASLKFYLSVDKENRMTKYNGQPPAKNAVVGLLDAKEIVELFKPSFNGLVWGDYLRNPEMKIITDLKVISSGCVVICDKTEQKYISVKNITDSLRNNNTKFLILDFEGKYKRINTEFDAVYGENFRIPLDCIALDYIFENDLNDCPLDAKAIIQGVILAVQKYVESSEDGFIPFETFVNIISSETANSNNAGMMIFANKLLKYKQKKIFADKKSHFSFVNSDISSFKIDVSNIDEKFYPLILKSVINVIKKKFYVISDINEDNINNSLLKYIYEKQNIRLLPILGHDNPFLRKIKAHCANTVVFAPETNVDEKEPNKEFLEKLNSDEFILCGENTLLIPFVVSLKTLMEKIKEENSLNTEDDMTVSDLDDLDKVNIAAVKEMLKGTNITENDLDSLNKIQDDEKKNLINLEKDVVNQASIPKEIIYPEHITEIVAVEESDILQENILENTSNNVDKQSLNNEEVKIEEDIDDTSISEPEEIYEEENLAEENSVEIFEDEDVDTEEFSQDEENQNSQEDTVEDTVVSEQEQITPEIQEESIEKDISIPEKVQNTVPEKLKSVEIKIKENLPEKNIPKQQPNPDELQIYEPKEQENIAVTFDEGDRVSHAKYGTGTIEKIIKYGKKNLCSIQFDNIGRRLLDPNITILQKL